MQNKVVFYRDDLRKFNFPANLPSLGLLQAVEGLTLHSKSLSHNFLHLSVQELLAAYHISHIDSSKQLEVFERMFGSSRFQAVLQYYSGFTKLANPVIRDFISTYTQQKSSIKDILPLLHCFYEAQEPPLCKLVCIQECIELTSALNPVDYLAIGYFVTSLLSLPSSDTPNILLKIRNVDNHRIKLLLLELSKCPIGEANERRSKITLQLQDQNYRCYSHQTIDSEGFQHHSAQVCLNLNETGFQYATQALTTMLQVNKTYTHLDLSGNWYFSDSGAYCVFQGLQHNTSLVHLNLSNIDLKSKEDTAQALITMLRVNKTLAHLDLSMNKNFTGAYKVFQGLKDNTSLVHLNLSNVDLGKEDTGQTLTSMLQVNKTLTHLDLSANWNFSNSGAYHVFQGLQHNTSLVHLNLSNTGLVATEDTAQALTTMLQVNKTLTHLNLSGNCNFSDAGAYCVFQGLQHNTSLVHLNLSNVDLKCTEDTAQALSTMLCVNKTIEHLNLSANWTFSKAVGAYCVCQGLQHNTSLVYVNLSNTGISDKGADYIAQAIESNRSLQTLDISCNRITDNGFVCIKKSLKTNTTVRLNK